VSTNQIYSIANKTAISQHHTQIADHSFQIPKPWGHQPRCHHLDKLNPAYSQTTLLSDEAIRAAESMKSANKSLVNFKLISKDKDGNKLYSGFELFDHIVKFGRRRAARDAIHATSEYLAVDYTQFQQKIVNP
jgi:hypothetical protein